MSVSESSAGPMIRLAGAAKTYATPAGAFVALHHLDLEVRAGEFVAVVGKSGSGKSTLLNLVGGIDEPSSGAVVVAGTDIGKLSPDALASWRGRTVGFVFQFFQLLPTLTILQPMATRSIR